LVGDVGNIVFLAEGTGDMGVAFLVYTSCLLGERISAILVGCDTSVCFLGVDVTMTELFFFGVLGDVIVV
jgi:hypothetical protein